MRTSHRQPFSGPTVHDITTSLLDFARRLKTLRRSVMDLDEGALKRVAEWGKGLEGFTDEHARHGLSFAQLVLEEARAGVGPYTDEQLFLLAIDVACCGLWLDDRFDKRVHETMPVNRDWVMGEDMTTRSTVEAQGFLLLRSRFETAAKAAKDYQLWFETARDTFRAYQANGLASRGALSWCYSEYLTVGEHSVVVLHLMAGVSLTHGLRMAERLSDPHVRQFVRHLCRAMRLQNDLASCERERIDGVRSNAVLMLERFASPQDAMAFVSAELEGYRRLMAIDVESLGAQDPLVCVGSALWSAAQHFYVVNTARYSRG